MVLLIDNYDSFSFNLYQLVGSIDSDIKVIRSDELTVQEIRDLKPNYVILSPGPGRPADAGVYESLLDECKGEFPILGVCLGHQAIGQVFGGAIVGIDHRRRARREYPGRQPGSGVDARPRRTRTVRGLS